MLQMVMLLSVSIDDLNSILYFSFTRTDSNPALESKSSHFSNMFAFFANFFLYLRFSSRFGFLISEKACESFFAKPSFFHAIGKRQFFGHFICKGRFLCKYL